MIRIKCAYYTKLFFITVLALVMYITIEISPEYPLLFIAITTTIIICIRLLWISALKDEKNLKKRTRVRFSNHKREYQHRKVA